MIRSLIGIILFLFSPILAAAQLTIIVDDIPASTPKNDPIFVAGNFQGWNPGSPNHQLTRDTILRIHHITLPARLGDIEFKFTRGNWQKVESDENGLYIPNRRYSVNEGDTIELQVLGWEDLDGNGGASTASENVSIITDSFPIPQLNRHRRIWVYLPPDYDTSGINYPVLYIQDGQNVFDRLTSYVGEWEVDETMNDLFKRGDPGIIIVGIDNGQLLRIEEYSPWINTRYNAGGEGIDYIDFIVNSLKPFIDSSYRTISGRENTGIMGSSLGGLISLYAGIEYQDVFSKVGAFSPAYWFNPEIFMHVIEKGKQYDMKIYQIAGSLEGDNYINNMFAMEDSLVAAGFGQDEIITREETDGEHSEWFWAREFEDAYLWLFRNSSMGIGDRETKPEDVNLYPNPTGGLINVNFSLANPGEVFIEIIDGLGVSKKTRYFDALDPGDHSLMLNVNDCKLPPGIYFCRIKTGTYTKSLKFVISQ